MAILRNVNKGKYTVIDNNILNNKDLSLKARGMLVTLLSLPDNWEFSENGLEHMFKDKQTSIRSALHELEESKYLIRNKLRNNKGQFVTEWIISEAPLVNQPVNKIHGGKSDVENRPQLNTNIKYLNNNICPSEDAHNLSLTELADNFDKIWKLYPRKDGKNTAFNHYKSWLNGKKYAGRTIKLTNRQMWFATKKYADLIVKEKVEKQYIKMGSTFFNEAIMEYVEEGIDE